MDEEIKALTAKIDGLEALVKQLLHHHTPEGRFAAEQAYLAYRKRHNPLFGSTLGANVDDPLTQVENIARGSDVGRLHAPVTNDWVGKI